MPVLSKTRRLPTRESRNTRREKRSFLAATLIAWTGLAAVARLETLNALAGNFLPHEFPANFQNPWHILDEPQTALANTMCWTVWWLYPLTSLLLLTLPFIAQFQENSHRRSFLWTTFVLLTIAAAILLHRGYLSTWITLSELKFDII